MAGNNLQIAEQVLWDEYHKLCQRVGVTPVTLDIYECDDLADLTIVSKHGTPVANSEPCYGKNLLILPLANGNDWPTTNRAFPPLSWRKDDWEIFYIELWHEFIHQVSDQLHGANDPKEAGRRRAGGTMSCKGHGLGWYQGVISVAAVFNVDADDLDLLLDGNPR